MWGITYETMNESILVCKIGMISGFRSVKCRKITYEAANQPSIVGNSQFPKYELRGNYICRIGWRITVRSFSGAVRLGSLK